MSCLRSRNGGKAKYENVQPVKQVLAKVVVPNRLLRFPVGSGEHTYREWHVGFTSEPANSGFLDDAEQLGLSADRHLADFVEKQRSVVGLLETSGPAFDGARERALLMTEEFAFHQRFGQRRAIHRDKRAPVPRTQAVDGARHQFLPRSALSANEDRRSGRRDLLDHRKDFFHRRRIACQFVQNTADS